MAILFVWFVYGLQALVLVVAVSLVVTRLVRWMQGRHRSPDRLLAEVRTLVDTQIATGLGQPLLAALAESEEALREQARHLTAAQRTLVTMWLMQPTTRVSVADCNAIIGALQATEAAPVSEEA